MWHPEPPYTGGSFAVIQESFVEHARDQEYDWIILDKQDSNLKKIPHLTVVEYPVPKLVELLVRKSLIIARGLEYLFVPVRIFLKAKKLIKKHEIEYIHLPIGELAFTYIPTYFLKKLYGVHVSTIIHSVGGETLELSISISRRYSKLRLEGRSPSTAFGIALSDKIFSVVGKKILRSFDAIGTVSSMMSQRLNMWLGNGIYTVFTFGFNYQAYDAIPKQTNTYDAVYLGRLIEQKGLTDMIFIWKMVVAKKPDARLLIIGDGEKSFVEALKAKIRINRIQDNIIFAGLKNGIEKIRLLKMSKVFLFLSHYESHALVIDEAIAAGLPIIAYNLPVYENRKKYTDQFYIYKEGSDEKIVNKILDIIENPPEESDLYHKFLKLPRWSEFATSEKKLVLNKKS